MKPIELTRPDPPRRKGAPEAKAKKKRPATSEEIAAFFGGAVRYTGPRAGGRARCERGHFVRAGEPCTRCAFG